VYCATHLLCNTPIVQHAYCVTRLLCNTPIMATVHPLPPITIRLERYKPLEEKVKEKLQDLSYKACRLCEMHRVLISVGSIIMAVVLKNTSIGPCYYYTSETLASDVSADCVNYLWKIAQCSTALESSPTWHWWIQSPQGLTMVKCNAVHKGPLCGAGSYNIIRNYIQMCNSRYGQ
jgi:hypothetical protein